MKLVQEQKSKLTLLARFYLFLRDRDAKIIEFFFLGLNLYIFALVVLPPYGYSPTGLIIRSIFQLVVTTCNIAALFTHTHLIRICSSILNAAIFALITARLWSAESPHTGVYALIMLLAVFVTWKINVR